MKIEYDRVADAMYMRYTNKPVKETRESAEGIVDYDRDWNVVGIEILGVEKIFSQSNISLRQEVELT